MQKSLKLSEGFALALHACAIVASRKGERVEAWKIAEELGSSYDHLSKVLQRLVKAGILNSVKGPGGGFTMEASPEKLSFKEVYEIMEGNLEFDTCLFAKRNCCLKRCVLGDLVSRINAQLTDYLTDTKVSDVMNLFQKDEDKPKAKSAGRRRK